MLARRLLPERICSTCTASKQKMWGCEEDALPIVFDNEEITRCPLRPYYEDPIWYNLILNEYMNYERWGFPESGTWKDQPNLLIELFDVIEIAKLDAEDHLRHKERERQRIAQTFSNRGSK